MSAIKLSMPDLLPKVWAAYMAKELQAQDPKLASGVSCQYDGPCAIGVGIPETQRARLDRSDTPEISFLIRTGKVKISDGELESEYSKLQSNHDNWTYYTSLREPQAEAAKLSEMRFVEYLKILSKKYGVEIPNVESTQS